MSKVVFKQWIYKPNKSGTPKAISRMMEYIATREGVELGSIDIEKEIEIISNEKKFNEELYIQYIATRKGVATDGQAHGLFGRLTDMKEMGDIEDLQLTRGYVENLVHNKKTVYNAVLSLKEEDAIDKGLITKSDWGELVDKHINDIARTMGIQPRTLEWVGAVHMEKDHPHVHIMYWDTAQKVGVNFIKPELANSIRKDITKDLFQEEIKEIRNRKDLQHNQLINMIFNDENSVLKNPKYEFCNMKLSDIYKLSQNKNVNYHILNRRMASKSVSELTHKLLLLDKQIRKDYPKGGLKYKYLPEHLKACLDELSKEIISNNPDIAKEFNKYIDAVKSQAEIYGGEKNINDYSQKAKKAMYNEIGNKVLATIKEMRTVQSSAKKEHRDIELQKKIAHYNRTMTMNLMQGIFDAVVEGNSRANANKNKTKKINKDMTKAQQADLIRKSKDVSLEWGD